MVLSGYTKIIFLVVKSAIMSPASKVWVISSPSVKNEYAKDIVSTSVGFVVNEYSQFEYNITNSPLK